MRLKILHMFSKLITHNFKPNKIIPNSNNNNNISQLKEIMPGLLQGYLSDDEMPNSLELLPPPPKHTSMNFLIDLEYAKKAVQSKNDICFTQATNDANLSFPSAVKSFESTLGLEINEEKTPKLYLLMRRIMTDAGLSTYAAKNHYKRERPFVINKTNTCTPEQEDLLRKVGSFPSGHAAVGWAWALVFCEIFPDKKEIIMERGYDFGKSRIVCHVHWYSDVKMGRIMGKATVKKLYDNIDFQKDFAAAKEEMLQIKNNTHKGQTIN